MKIDGIKRGINRASSAKKASRARGSSSGGKISGVEKFAAEDSVEVSNHAATLDLIRDLVDSTPDMRMDQVERIVGEIRGGKYKINFEKVAEGFIKEAVMNEMIRKESRTKGKD